MGLRLKTLARYIEELFPEFKATVTKTWQDTDRQYNRIRFPGKGRAGNELRVWERNFSGKGFPAPVFSHNSAECYRGNWEVAKWIVGECESRGIAVPAIITNMVVASWAGR